MTGFEPATSRPVILRSTIDLHDRPVLINPIFNKLEIIYELKLHFILYIVKNLSISIIEDSINCPRIHYVRKDAKKLAIKHKNLTKFVL